MRRIRLKVAYDGTDYCGFQAQPEVPTIEGKLNLAISALTGEEISVIGASRTDSGVHALGNVAVFDTASAIPADRFMYALLPFLPEDIRIVSSDEVEADWHPRKNECIKTYRYTIYCGPVENPMLRRAAMFYKGRLDTEKMSEAAAYLIGEHDFTSFANPSSQVLISGGDAVRTIYSLDISEDPDEAFAGSKIYLTIKGSGFLYNMVRIIAGSLINVGRGHWEPGHIRTVLCAKDRRLAGPTAEARGLMLMDIDYIRLGTENTNEIHGSSGKTD